MGCGEGWQVEAEGPAAHERVPQTQVSNKLEATSLLTPARAIQLPLGYVENFRRCNCYRDYIAVDESAYGCPYVHACIRTFFNLDGHHMQFNVISSDMLRDAQKHPERHRNLIVRVAGYSDYFVDLGVDLQNEIIKRTEQTTF